MTYFQLFSTMANLLHVRGSHTVRGGIDMRDHRRSGGDPDITSGRYDFTSKFTSREDDGLTPSGSLGHSYAAFLMGLPASNTAETNGTYALGNLYAGWFVQDQWRVQPKLTINFGLRLAYGWGRQERHDRAIGWFDPTAKLPITDAAQAAYAKSPIPELAASAFSVLGGSIYPGVNGASRRLQAGEFMWLPRIGMAWQFDSRTVLRAGYGIYFDTLNAQNLPLAEIAFRFPHRKRAARPPVFKSELRRPR